MAIKIVIKDGKTFYEAYVNGFDARGVRIQRRRRWIETERKAKTVEFELKRELAMLREQKVPYRWHEWFSLCLKRMKMELRNSTVVNYEWKVRKWIHPHWANLEIHTINKGLVMDTIFEKCADIKTPHSRKTLLKMVKRIFQMAVEDGHLERNPCIGITIKVPEVEQKVLTNSEVEIFLREAKHTNHRFYPMWAMALMTGMRSGELFALKWTDVDLEARIISISKQWTSKNGFGPTKTQRSRVVPVSEDLFIFIKDLRGKRATEGEFVLPQFPEWENGEQARITREFCQAIGITCVKFHDLRATFITNLLARGESLARVMSMVGHSQIKTTNGYLRKAGVEVRGATDKLGYSLPKEADSKVLKLVRSGNESES